MHVNTSVKPGVKHSIISDTVKLSRMKKHTKKTVSKSINHYTQYRLSFICTYQDQMEMINSTGQ